MKSSICVPVDSRPSRTIPTSASKEDLPSHRACSRSSTSLPTTRTWKRTKWVRVGKWGDADDAKPRSCWNAIARVRSRRSKPQLIVIAKAAGRSNPERSAHGGLPRRLRHPRTDEGFELGYAQSPATVIPSIADRRHVDRCGYHSRSLADAQLFRTSSIRLPATVNSATGPASSPLDDADSPKRPGCNRQSLR